MNVAHNYEYVCSNQTGPTNTKNKLYLFVAMSCVH